MSEIFTLDNENFQLYVKCCAALSLNTLLKAPLTGMVRRANGAVENMEDAAMFAKGDTEKAKKMMVKNENVERVRRAHQNDLENVPFFMTLGLLYICTNPCPTLVKYHFLGFTGCRLLHTFSYLVLQKQPWRAISFLGGVASCVSMAVRLLM